MESCFVFSRITVFVDVYADIFAELKMPNVSNQALLLVKLLLIRKISFNVGHSL